MTAALQVVHWLAALLVLAESLNKLERTNPCACALTAHARLVDGLKALAWLLLAFGAGCVVAAPLLINIGAQASPAILFSSPPRPADTAVLLGFAVLIVRTRVKEG